MGEIIPGAGGRAVLLVPATTEAPRWITVLGEHASKQGCEVVCIASDIGDALREISAGRADRLIVIHSYLLRPLIEIVGDQPPARSYR